MVLNEKSLGLPVVDGRTGDILGHRTIPLFHKPEFSLAFLVVCADESDYGDESQFLIHYSDIQYVNVKHAIAVKKCIDGAQSFRLSPEEYAELIGLPVYYEDGTEIGRLTEVQFDPEAGILDTATITSGTGRKEILRRQILMSDSFSVYIKRDHVEAAGSVPFGKLWAPHYTGMPESLVPEMQDTYVTDDVLLYEDAQPEDKSGDESAAPTMELVNAILEDAEGVSENVRTQEEAAAPSTAEDDMLTLELKPEEESVYSAEPEPLLSFAGEEDAKEASFAEESSATEDDISDRFEMSEPTEPDFENEIEVFKEEPDGVEDAMPELIASGEDDLVPVDSTAEELAVFAEDKPMEELAVLLEEEKTLEEYPAMAEEEPVEENAAEEKPPVNAGPIPLYAQVFPDDEIEEQPQTKENEKKKSEKSGKEQGKRKDKKKSKTKGKSFWKSSISQIVGMCLLGGAYFLLSVYQIL